MIFLNFFLFEFRYQWESWSQTQRAYFRDPFQIYCFIHSYSEDGYITPTSTSVTISWINILSIGVKFQEV